MQIVLFFSIPTHADQISEPPEFCSVVLLYAPEYKFVADKKGGQAKKIYSMALVRFPVCAFGATHLSLIGAEFMGWI